MDYKQIAETLDKDPITARRIKEHISPARLFEVLELEKELKDIPIDSLFGDDRITEIVDLFVKKTDYINNGFLKTLLEDVDRYELQKLIKWLDLFDDED